MDTPIRPAGADDRDRLVELMRAFYTETGSPFEAESARTAFGELLGDPRLGRVWLVLDAGEVAGYVAVTFGFSLEYSGRDAFLDDFFLRPASRGAGLGTRVLEAVEPACRALGIRALHLEVERTNRVAQALYRRRGFVDNDRRLLSKRLGVGRAG